MVTVGSTGSVDRYFPTFDGNGNVNEYLDSTGATVAHYEYDPFGKTTVATGSKANDFSHRFSTKPLDLTTGLYYYGYRFYDPETGRWPSKDPIEEAGGINLYGFVGNDGIGTWDYLGQNFASDFGSEFKNVFGQIGNGVKNSVVSTAKGVATMAVNEYGYIKEGPYSYFDKNMNRINSVSEDVEGIFDSMNRVIDDPAYRDASFDFLVTQVDDMAYILDAASRNPDCLEKLLILANVATIDALIVQLATKGFGAGANAASPQIRKAIQRLKAADGGGGKSPGGSVNTTVETSSSGGQGLTFEYDYPKPRVRANARAGAGRESYVQGKLKGKFKDASVQREQYLRNADGTIAKDPLTGKGRRVDHVVIQGGKARYVVETTSKTANKSAQLAKEARIRANGGKYIRDRNTGDLIDISKTPTRVSRRR
jgi:RHS repeat-associated protein